jgi:hypothetical protein
VDFELLGEIRNIELIAKGSRLRVRRFLQRRYGGGRWRKLKGIATVRLVDGRIREAEIHWYEAHGVGRTGFKIIRFFPETW